MLETPLSEEISPGKVQNLFPRAVWLYLMRLDDFWASLFRASLPPAPGLTASSCSYESLPPASFGFPLAVAPCGSATVAVIGSDWLLSSNKILPMLGTLRGRPPGRPVGACSRAGRGRPARTRRSAPQFFTRPYGQGWACN